MDHTINANLKLDADFEKKVEHKSKISADPFYSDSNMRYLEKKMSDFKAGKLIFEQHDLIEE